LKIAISVKIIGNGFSDKIKKMKKISFLCICLAIVSCLKGASVDVETASRVARNSFYEQINSLHSVDFSSIQPSLAYTCIEQSEIYYYIFNIPDSGFVIVSADDAVMPVLGFSFEGIYISENQPPAFIRWMEDYKDQIKIVKEKGYTASVNIANEWQRLSKQSPVALRSIKSVLPLLHSKWNQGKFYNEYCPVDSLCPADGHTYAGCVPTAAGQIMNYYRWPLTGTGSYSYVHPVYGTLSADFASTTYRWGEMPSSLNTYNSAIAELLFHLGVSVDLDYGPDGSGMFNHKMAYALRTNFGYSPSTEYIFRDTTHLDWKGIILNHLDNNMPLYYAGWADTINFSGHAFVCDGYQDTTFFHFNWGWGGSYDGYFSVDNLTPGGDDFTLDHELIVNIFPDGAYPYYCNGSDTLTSMGGTIGDGSGPVNNYTNNADCFWLIAPEDSVTTIKLQFLEFNVVGPDDKLIVYNGNDTGDPVLGTFYGSSLPSQVTATGQYMLLHFISNDSINNLGWLAEYSTTVPVYCNGIQTLTASSGSIDDGSGPRDYHNNSLCRWQIQSVGATAISLHVNLMDLGVGDFVNVYNQQNGDLISHLTGDSVPQDIICPSGEMLLYFKTDGKYTAGGWDVNYFVSSGISQPEELIDFNVYPNPAGEWFNVSGSLIRSQNLTFELMNSSLLLVKKIQTDSEPGNINMQITTNGLKPGLYFLRIKGETDIITKKIVILE
jgi:hypothetical protein